MIGGTFRHTLTPLLAPCAGSFPIQQLISLKHFRPTAHVTKVVTRAAATLQTARQSPQNSDSQRAAEFRSLGLSPELLVATQEHGLIEPTEIQVSRHPGVGPKPIHSFHVTSCSFELTGCAGLQAAAIPQMMQGGDVLLASHTGSGKTLAYLLPLVSSVTLRAPTTCHDICRQGPFVYII